VHQLLLADHLENVAVLAYEGAKKGIDINLDALHAISAEYDKMTVCQLVSFRHRLLLMCFRYD